MMIGPARILTCPECGGSKEVMSLLSGNSFGADMWSDGRMDAPMLPEPSMIQKCPHCGKYFWLPDQPFVRVKDWHECHDLGALSFTELKEGVIQLLSKCADEAMETDIRLQFLMAYNDEFHRRWKDGTRYRINTEPAVSDTKMFRENLERLYFLFLYQEDRSSAAEMLRELGLYKECMTLIENLEGFNPNDRLEYNAQVYRHAWAHSPLVFYRQTPQTPGVVIDPNDLP